MPNLHSSFSTRHAVTGRALIAVVIGIVTVITPTTARPVTDEIREEVISLSRMAGAACSQGCDWSAILNMCENAKTKITAYDYDPELSGFVEKCFADVYFYHTIVLPPPTPFFCGFYRRAKEYFAAGVQAGNTKLI